MSGCRVEGFYSVLSPTSPEEVNPFAQQGALLGGEFAVPGWI